MLGRRALAWALGAGVLGYGGVAAALYLKQREILFRPDGTRPDAAAVGVAGLTTVTLRAAGLDLLAWWLPPAQAARPTLLYLHGNGGSLVHRADRLRRFAAAGFGVLMPEYPGYGGNPGNPSETAWVATGEAALAFLQARQVGAIVAYGESLGTGVASRLAAERPLAGLVLESPFTSVTALARQQYWYMPVDWLVRDRFDTLSRIGRARAPVLVALGERDAIVPPWMGRAVYAAAPEPKQLWTAPEGGHEDLAQFGLIEAVTAWLDGRSPAPHE